MGGNRSARRGGRAAPGNSFAGQRNGQKIIHNATRFQEPLGSIAVYDGLTFVGAVIPVRGKFVAIDPSGRRLGEHDLQHRAAHQLYQAAARQGGER